MHDVLDQTYLRAWKIMLSSNPQSDELKVFLRNINRMVQNVKTMITVAVLISMVTQRGVLVVRIAYGCPYYKDPAIFRLFLKYHK